MGKTGLYDLDPDQVESEDEEDEKFFRAEAEKETPGPGSVIINRIIDRIQSLSSSVMMLQVQAE